MKPIGFIGAGNMAEAIISGLIKKGLITARELMIFDIKQDRMDHLRSSLGVEVASSALDLTRSRDIVILAVKPDQVLPLLKDIKSALAKKVVISIAAGITLKSMLEVLGEKAKVIRVMPNTPSLVLEGAAVIAASPSCTGEDRRIARDIFASVGVCLEMDEKFLNAVTALSGSGPAFCFLFLEALSDGAVKAGLPRDVALKLAAATMRGAASMVLDLGKHPGQLKDMVTSPSGTTIEGIAVLESKGFRAAVIDAISAAYNRAEVLSGKS
ncbi:MAG TPA: pyrroline-5-carboxylate reductase [Desulfomonilia bacterium]|nr:pyrroline-5-carboxylate reductase [Desulfomonilia bacterium]